MAGPGSTRAGRGAWLLAAIVAAVLVGGCASGPPAGRDGAEANPPPDLELVPDAQPRVEPLRQGGPNKPYTVLGRRYTPLAEDAPLNERGLASWYGRKFHGRPTAMGETYDMYAMTAAHKTMPLPSYARVRNPANGREIVVRVNDRGPFHDGRIIDLSYTAALKLGVLRGVAPVEVERITHDEIRNGLGRAPVAAPMAPLDAADDAPVAASAGYWLQLGAFRDREGAAQLQRLIEREAAWLAPQLALQDDGAWARVQAGPYATRDDAQAAAARLADALPLQALVVQRR
jgi:rare lipoprotein A